MYILVEDPCPHLPLLLGRGTTPYYIAYQNICSVCTVIENCISYIKVFCIPAHKLRLFMYFSEGTVNEKHVLLLQMGNWAPGIDPIRMIEFQLFAMEVKLRDQPVRLFYLNHVYLKTPFFHPRDTFFCPSMLPSSQFSSKWWNFRSKFFHRKDSQGDISSWESGNQAQEMRPHEGIVKTHLLVP